MIYNVLTFIGALNVAYAAYVTLSLIWGFSVGASFKETVRAIKRGEIFDL